MTVSSMDRRSETGPAHSAPSTPMNMGRISVAGTWKIICLDRERMEACTG